jgi:hypothetical protein
MHYAFFLERQSLWFSVLFSFFCWNKWLDPNKFLLEKLPCFSFAKNTPFSTLIVQRVFSFSATAFRFRFSPWFVFRSCYIFTSRCILTSGPSWYSSKKSCFKKVRMVLEKRKSCLMSLWKIMRCFYYLEALFWFSPWCFIWVDFAQAHTC